MSQEIKSLSDYKKQQAIDRLKSWEIRYAIIGVLKLNDDLYPIDSSIVCTKEQLEEAKKKFVYWEVYELKKMV